MRALKIVFLNVVVFLVLVEAISAVVLSSRYHTFCYFGLPPVASTGEWIAHADRNRLVKNWNDNHPLLHPLFSAIGVPGKREPDQPYDTARWAKYIQQGNLYQPGPDEAVVGVFGGSVAYDLALYLAEPLSALPAFAGKKITVLMLAGAGYKEPQQLVQLAYALAAGQKFDLVLNVDGYNDVKGGLTNMEKGVSYTVPNCDAQFLFDWILRNDTGSGQDQVRHAQMVLDSWRLHRAAARANETKSAAVRLALETWVERAKKTLRAEQASFLSDFHMKGRLEYFGLPDGPQGDPLSNMPQLAKHWAKSSALMDQLCRRAAIPYMHVLQPNQYYGAKPISDKERATAVTDPSNQNVIPQVYPLLQKELAGLKAQGVAVLDATPVFDHEADTLYYDNCCHMNEKGNRIFARFVVKALGKALAAGK